MYGEAGVGAVPLVFYCLSIGLLYLHIDSMGSKCDPLDACPALAVTSNGAHMAPIGSHDSRHESLIEKPEAPATMLS